MRNKDRRRSKHAIALAAASTLICLLAAACSSADGDSTAGEGALGTIPPDSPSPAKSTLTFGSISADTGPVILSSIADGTEAWARYVNTHGGIGGHPVKIVRCDDGLDATKNQDCARRLIQDTSVLAVIGGETVVTPLVAAPLLNQAGLSYLSTETTGEGEMKGPAMFAITGGAITQFAALAKHFPANGAKKVALVNAASTSSSKAAARTTEEVKAAGGSVVATVFAKPGTPDYSPVATQLLSANPDVIFTGVTPTDLPALVRAIRQQNPTVKIATLASQWPATTVKTLGDTKDGLYMATDWAAFPDDSADPDITAMRVMLHRMGRQASFGQGSMSGWLGGRAMEAAIAGMKDDKITRAGLTAHLRAATLTVKGVPVPLTLPKGSAPGGYDGLANPSAYINQWKGDDLKQVALVRDVFAPAGG
ncbi:ABC transporter substrate-binding protein [Actinomadura rugatobispora]|uniref:ABC transporter substrate-binding protein n=1 Tax=Actinomadura rugatobispora TaxID=1994 RepID=A0ABW1AA18_9ACTN|nr:ABC transporter substrate-binding protein [Actinomadura rugatobispora]